jgi:hypothetical protein
MVSNATTIPVAPAGGSCSDPLGYPAELFSRAARGGNVGTITLHKSAVSSGGTGAVAEPTRAESITGTFQRIDYSQLLSYPGSGPSVGSCVVNSFFGQSPVAGFAMPFAGLDAGAALTVAGPSGSRTLERHWQQRGLYRSETVMGSPGNASSAIAQEFLTPGRFTATGAGGVDLTAFSASLIWPAGFNWTNQNVISVVPRSQDLVVRWEGAAADSLVTISGHSIGGTAVAPVGTNFVCLAGGSAGSFAIPAIVLQLLPASVSKGDGTYNGQLSVAVSGVPVTFSAGGLDYGAVNYSSAVARGVRFD